MSSQVKTLAAMLVFSVSFLEPLNAQQTALKGQVLDAETRSPLPNVHVYLSQTSIGSTTDLNGFFEIWHVPPGSYEVIASMLGYENGSRHIEISPNNAEYSLSFRLKPSILELEAVEIEGRRPRGWRRNLRRFTELFIGTGPNAAGTKILNPYVLDFQSSDGQFYAEASAPIEVENLALGYRITFELDEFRMDEKSELLYMHGPFFFQELVPTNADEASRWERNRAQTYRGSLQHILASMIARTTTAEDITLRLDDRINAPYSDEKPSLRSIEGVGTIAPTERPYLYRLAFPNYLQVIYMDQRSWIRMNADRATVHESGYLYAVPCTTGALSVYGALAKRRISDLLPREYNWSTRSE